MKTGFFRVDSQNTDARPAAFNVDYQNQIWCKFSNQIYDYDSQMASYLYRVSKYARPNLRKGGSTPQYKKVLKEHKPSEAWFTI